MKENNELLGELNSYYRTQMNVLSKYLQIVWNRFNWFTTLNVGLISFYTTQPDNEAISYILPKLGIAISIAWFIGGILDYATVKKLNSKGKAIRILIKEELNIEDLKDTDNNVSMFDAPIKYIDKEVRQHFLLYLFPLIIILTWIYLLVSS